MLFWSYWPVLLCWSYWPILLYCFGLIDLLCCFGLIDTFCYVGLIDLFCYVILVLLTCFVMLFWSYWPVLLCWSYWPFCYVVLVLLTCFVMLFWFYWPVLSCCFGLIDLFCYVILVFYGTLVTQNNITKQVSQKQRSIPHLNSHFSPFNTPLCITFFSVPHYLQPWFQYKTLLRRSLLSSLLDRNIHFLIGWDPS